MFRDNKKRKVVMLDDHQASAIARMRAMPPSQSHRPAQPQNNYKKVNRGGPSKPNVRKDIANKLFKQKVLPLRPERPKAVIKSAEDHAHASTSNTAAYGNRPRSNNFKAASASHMQKENRAEQASLLNMKQSIINGSLFNLDCQVKAKTFRTLPLEFASLQHYIRAYEPLLLEESRAGIKNTFEEMCAKRKSIAGTLSNIYQNASGNLQVTVNHDCPPQLFSKEDIIVLCSERPPVEGALQWINRRLKRNRGLHSKHFFCCASLIEKAHIAGELTLDIYPACSNDSQVCKGDCKSILDGLRSRKGHNVFFINCGNLVTQVREYRALHNMKSYPLLKHILKPSLLKESEDPQLPEECSGKLFQNFLSKHFNQQQYKAVCSAASHMASASPIDDSNSNGTFTLVHGPPGTGKTHTIWGILNVIHLVCFQRYYQALNSSLTGTGNAGNSSAMQQQGRMSKRIRELLMNSDETHQQRILAQLALKPKILVCAPSNAAVDEITKRIVSMGFYDMNCKVYHPDVVRVSALETQLSSVTERVSAKEQARRFISISNQEWQYRYQQSQINIDHLSSAIKRLVKELQHCGDLSTQEASLIKLVALQEERDKHCLHIERLFYARGKNIDGNHSELHASQLLENSFIEEAEIVFSTLSTSSKRAFDRLKLRFDVVLIDEAAQASEIESLQPLQYGAKHAVLVGDPQQLPPTVLSQVAAGALFERSLLERLQGAGCPTIQLHEQFRMHPQIREFPSDYFYQGHLHDSKAVLTVSPPAFIDQKFFKPYTVFHIEGKQERNKSGSTSNSAEVEFVVDLFEHFRRRCGENIKLYSVGIITPYRYQKEKLCQAMMKKYGTMGPESQASNVRIDTIDSFQGKERDVILLSCVRSSSTHDKSVKNLGFVADIRRMNVAITRAKHMLWIVGDLDCLRENETWAALIENAIKRKCVIFNGKQLLLNAQSDSVAQDSSEVPKAQSKTDDDAPKQPPIIPGLSSISSNKEAETTS